MCKKGRVLFREEDGIRERREGGGRTCALQIAETWREEGKENKKTCGGAGPGPRRGGGRQRVATGRAAEEENQVLRRGSVAVAPTPLHTVTQGKSAVGHGRILSQRFSNLQSKFKGVMLTPPSPAGARGPRPGVAPVVPKAKSNK